MPKKATMKKNLRKDHKLRIKSKKQKKQNKTKQLIKNEWDEGKEKQPYANIVTKSQIEAFGAQKVDKQQNPWRGP